MSRKQRREAYARTLQALGEWQKTDPVALERSYHQFNYLKSTAYFLVFAFISNFSLTRLLEEPEPLFLQFVQGYPLHATGALICLGVLLYIFRERERYFYGLSETAFACALIHVSVNELSKAPSQTLAAAGAALYVLVRGLDNLVQGYKSPLIRHADVSDKLHELGER